MDIATIQRRLDILEKHEMDIKNAKEMLKGELESSPEYMQLTEEEKEVKNKRKRIKEEILHHGPNQKLLEEIKSSTEEISTLKEILSAELMQVYEESKTDSITDANGEVRKFKVLAKILPRGVQNRDNFGKYEKGLEEA